MVMSAPGTILVIGGGLGGLAFAQILRHSLVGDKYKVMIFERDESSTQRGQGYHIGINHAGASHISTIPHITSVLDTNRHKDTAFSFVDGDLNSMAQFKQGPGADGTAGLVNRWKLHSALAEGLEIQRGKKFLRYEESEDHVVAYFDDGTQATGDLLVGADGVKSRVRAQRCPALQLHQLPILNTAGSIAITREVEAKIPTVVKLANQVSLARALAPKGNTVMVMEYEAPNGETRLLWSYSFPAPPSDNSLPSDPLELKQAIDARAAIFGTDLAVLIRDTPAEDYIYDAPRYLMSVTPVKGNPLGATSRVTLIGDAAHAMTTHRGLGANTAFADAFDLAQALGEVDPWGALGKYEATMMERGFEAVKASSQSTEMIHLVGFKGVVRNAVIRVVGWILWAKHHLFRS